MHPPNTDWREHDLNIQDLHRHLLQHGRLEPGSRLDVDATYLESLQRDQLQTQDVRETVCPYFPAGRIRLSSLHEVVVPALDQPIVIEGVGVEPPFLGMSVRVELDIVELPTDRSTLRVAIYAFGDAARNWTVSASFLVYADSPLRNLRFRAVDATDTPLLRLSSHAQPERLLLPAMCLLGQLDLESLSGAAHALFLGSESTLAIPVAGLIVAAPPAATAPFPDRPWPQITLRGALPATEARTLGGLLSLTKLELSGSGSPHYNFATRRLEIASSLSWFTDLQLAGWPAERRIPIGVTIEQNHGRARIFSDPSAALSLTFDELSRLVPQTALTVPSDTGLDLAGRIELKKLEISLDTASTTSDLIEWISLDLQTADDNRWVLVERVLALDAIDLHFLVRKPTSTPSVELAISGLVGIGKRATLRLTTMLTGDASGADYSFSGNLVGDSDLNITEVLTHFLGRDQHHGLPEL
ncbi:MAG: hypothetical protein ACRD2A_09975, partial [Vicinamibacterales bacterium]